ncbi:MAG TPA: sialidase family protein [Nitrososphaeraceae archaeon]|nr:sialidase family protein [Nitrososphaeraceae archaeon]
METKHYHRLTAIIVVVLISISVLCSSIFQPTSAQLFGQNIGLSNSKSSEPEISAYGNNVYIVWRDETTGNGDIYFRASDDSGDHFRNIKNLGTTKESSSEPRISSVGNNIYVAWRDETTGDGNIYFRRSTNYGNIFDEIEKLSNVNASSSELQMSTYQNNLYVIWTQSTFNNMKIFFDSSRNLGSDFYNSVDLSRNLTSSYYPRLEVSHGNIYVVWRDGNNIDNTHIYFKRISEEYRPNT